MSFKIEIPYRRCRKISYCKKPVLMESKEYKKFLKIMRKAKSVQFQHIILGVPKNWQDGIEVQKCTELPTDGQHGKAIKFLHKIQLKEFEEKWSINDLKWQYKDEIKEAKR